MITFSRAGFSGAQAFPCHWAGDENSTWEAFRVFILAGLSAGISGIPFWGWDLGGFSEEIPSAELYLCSAAMVTFCPIMQYHPEYNGRKEPSRDRKPWNIQERAGAEDTIPVFVREGSILPLNLDESLTLANPVGNRVDRYDHLCFKLYGDGNEFYEWFDSVGQKTTLRQPFHDKDSGPLRLDVPALPYPVTLIFYTQELPEITVDEVPAGERIQIGRPLDGRQTRIIS